MVKLINLNIEEHSLIKHFSDKKNKEAQKCIEYIKYIGESDPLKYLPNKSQYSVSFELKEATSELANCIRRGIMDEIYIYSMDINFDNIITDDKFILSDYFKMKLELIPISQDIDYDNNNFDISIDIKNTTDDIIKIYSKDIIVFDKEKKKNISIMIDNIVIANLHSNKSLTIKKISIVKAQSKTNYGKHCSVSRLMYEILDVKPLDEQKLHSTGDSSLNSKPSHFRIGYKTHRNIKPKLIMVKFCTEIINRLILINTEAKNIKSTDIQYFSNKLEMTTKGSMKIFHLKGEYWTVANIISKYCYLEDTDINFVCPGIVHPSSELSFVKIIRLQALKIFINSIKKIIIDLELIKKIFI